MRSRSVSGDASTLIYLAKAGTFGGAERCVPGISVPPGVWKEAVEAGERIGAPEVGRIRRATRTGFLVRAQLSRRQQAVVETVAEDHRLGRGESEVIALASPTGAALLDEGRATRVATSLGIEVTSTLLLPVAGVRGGSLEVAPAREMLRKLAVVTGATAAVVFEIETALTRERP
jgi:predicted nucleic acid-binding protein